MRSKFVRWLVSASVAGGTLLGGVQLQEASAQPDVRDHRRKGPVVVNAGPREAPPPRRTEKIGKRPGHVWVAGQWEWKRGRWEWEPGHWEKRQRGKRWRERRWEQQGDAWVKIDGGWDDYDDRPRTAPPPLREEKWQPRRGFVFVKGHWDWDGDEWQWVKGKWERERAGKRWRERRWEQQGGAWVMVEGDWIDAPAFPSAAPPPLQAEKIGTRRGFIWVKGRWDWRNGDWQWMPGRWERQRANQAWNDGRWENRNGQWTWIDGAWGTVAVQPVAQPPVVGYPTSPPPALQVETPGTRAGFIWVRGRWAWRNGKYEWVAGHWERQRANQAWTEGRWDNRNGQWVWVDGGWGVGTVTPPPTVGPAPRPVAPPVVAPAAPPPGPTIAPPALQVENPGARAGFIWVRGRWDWRNGKYEWISGHWERQRANVRWNDGRWEQRRQGNVSYWVWLEGGWR